MVKNNRNWQTKKLGNLFNITSSKRVFKSEWTNQGIPFYRAREIVSIANHKPLKDPIFISEDMYKKYISKYGKPEKNDILITGVGTLGICYIIKEEDKFYFKDGNIIWLKNTSDVNSKYVEYFFRSDMLKKQIKSAPKGATVGTFTITRANNTKIPLPSLPEQIRIVKILDEAFAEMETAKKNAERNLRNAKELFESYLQEVFNSEKLKVESEKWEEGKLGEVYDVRDGTHDSPKYQKEGYLLITSKNLRGGFNTRNAKFITEKDYRKINERSKVNKGDILFAMIGTIGVPTVIEEEPNFAIKNVALFKVSKKQSNYFLKYYLDSPFVIEKMKREARGTTQKFVGLGYLRNFKIFLPPLVIQKQIVAKLDTLSVSTKKLEKNYQQKIDNLDELKKSVLKKAFEGEL